MATPIKSATYPSINKADIPAVLELSAGTLANVSFVSGIKDSPDYQSYLFARFTNVSETEYAALYQQYTQQSNGIDPSCTLLFEWGQLKTNYNNNELSLEAYIR